MKKIILIAILISSFQTFAQRSKSKNKSKNEINFSGKYIGEFSDLKNAKGTIKISLYQSNNGFVEGIVLMEKDDLKMITGIIRINGNGKFIAGHFTPSEIKNSTWSLENTKYPKPKSSYDCGWSLFGELKDKNAKLIIGKGVPINCSESNLMEFTLHRKE